MPDKPFLRQRFYRPPVMQELLSPRSSLPPPRRIAIISPHFDDAELGVGGVMCELAERGCKVTVIVLYAGYRSPGFRGADLTNEEKTEIRWAESREAVRVTGAELLFLDISAYHRCPKTYKPSDEDIESLADELDLRKPDWLFQPSRYDQHRAHQAARHLVEQSQRLRTTPQVVTLAYETPWGVLGGGRDSAPTHCFAYPKEIARRKREAILKFKSQLRAVRYDIWSECHSRAWLIKSDELRRGHHDHQALPVELAAMEVFRLESLMTAGDQDGTRHRRQVMHG